MACIRNLGLTTLPIVCIDVENYYEPFREMLARAYEDKLISKPPDDIVHFAPTSEQAIRWIEVTMAKQDKDKPDLNKDPEKRKKILNKGSFYAGAPPIVNDLPNEREKANETKMLYMVTIAFAMGVSLGLCAGRYSR